MRSCSLPFYVDRALDAHQEVGQARPPTRLHREHVKQAGQEWPAHLQAAPHQLRLKQGVDIVASLRLRRAVMESLPECASKSYESGSIAWFRKQDHDEALRHGQVQR